MSSMDIPREKEVPNKASLCTTNGWFPHCAHSIPFTHPVPETRCLNAKTKEHAALRANMSARV